MCIRDRDKVAATWKQEISVEYDKIKALYNKYQAEQVLLTDCLLYTSDAADERSSVDLGGRRIIKKKNNIDYCELAVWLRKQQ